MVLTYDQKHDNPGVGKFKSMWHDPYMISCILEKGAYELVDYDGIPLADPCNVIYIKRYYV